MFAERVIRALFGPLFDALAREIRGDVSDAESRLTKRINTMDVLLQEALDRLTSIVGAEGTRVIGAVGKETGEIKTALKGVAKQIRDGLNPAAAAAAIDRAADSVGALGDQLVTGIDALSDTITVENAEPDAEEPPAGGGTGEPA
jgi:hypothetical protein